MAIIDGVVRLVYRNPALLGAIRRARLDQVGQRLRLTGTDSRPPKRWIAPPLKWVQLLARLGAVAGAVEPTVSAVQPVASADERVGGAFEPRVKADSSARGHGILWAAANSHQNQQAAKRLLFRLVNRADLAAEPDKLWLLATAVAARFPAPETMAQLIRITRFGTAAELCPALLALMDSPDTAGRLDLPLQLVAKPIVEADSTGRLTVHTGIHRVAREVITRWLAKHDIAIAMWDRHRSIFRTPTATELDHIHGDIPETRFIRLRRDIARIRFAKPCLLVPWHTSIVLTDLPKASAGLALSALAQYSGSEVVAIGYDLIPIASAELRPPENTAATLAGLVPLKRAKRIAAISNSAAREFAGFSSMLAAQGLTGPEVRAVPLPTEVAPLQFAPLTEATVTRPTNHRPIILLTGSREPHKNQRALLHAAETLWADGLDFELRLAGGKGWRDDALPTIERLKAKGYPIVDLGRVSEAQLWEELQTADAVAFASLHEGYGLPVAEALSAGTPVLTSDYGSQAEIAAGGGVLMADPRDDQALADGMRRLITEPDLRAKLREAAVQRPKTTWDDYANRLWEVLIEGNDGN